MTQNTLPNETEAAAFDHFGSPEVLTLRTLPVPEMAEDEILLRVRVAGVGVWDAVHRDGTFAPEGSTFPMVPGSDAVGVVIAAGPAVTDVAVGDEVYAYAWARPKGGFYAQYAVTKGAYAITLPAGLPEDQAGALGTDGLTALSGLDTLGLKEGQTLLIYGASGGLGHLALQLAKRSGLRVVAVASGDDGVALVQRLGSDLALDGHREPAELADEVGAFAPEGLDGMLVATTGESLAALVPLLRSKGTIAHPNGVELDAASVGDTQVQAFDGEMSRVQLRRLNELVEAGPFEVHIAESFPLAQAAGAHERMQHHYLGKLVLTV